MIYVQPDVGSLLTWSTCRMQWRGILNLFRTGRGNIGQGIPAPLNVAETDIIMGSLNLAAVTLTVNAVSWEVWGSAEDRATCFRHAVWSWQLPTIILEGSPLGVTPLVSPIANAGIDKDYLQVKDLPVSRGILVLAVPQVIAPQTDICLRLNLAVDLQDSVDVRFTLHGTYKFGTQEDGKNT